MSSMNMNNMAELGFPDDIIKTTLQQSLDKSNKQVSEQLIRDEEFMYRSPRIGEGRG